LHGIIIWNFEITISHCVRSNNSKRYAQLTPRKKALRSFFPITFRINWEIPPKRPFYSSICMFFYVNIKIRHFRNTFITTKFVFHYIYVLHQAYKHTIPSRHSECKIIILCYIIIGVFAVRSQRTYYFDIMISYYTLDVYRRYTFLKIRIIWDILHFGHFIKLLIILLCGHAINHKKFMNIIYCVDWTLITKS